MSEQLDDIVENLRESDSWIRIIFMVGFSIGLYLVIAPIVVVLTIVQALFSVISGEANSNLRRFGNALTDYVGQILRYLTYNTDDKPFPFSDFPALDEEESGDDPADPSATDNNTTSRSPASTREAAAASQVSDREPPAAPDRADKDSDDIESDRYRDSDNNDDDLDDGSLRYPG